MFNSLLKTLDGKKTHLVALVDVVYGVISHHHSLNGFAPYILSGAGLSAVRVGIKAEAAKIRATIATLEAKLPAPVASVVDPEVAKVESEAEKAA